MPGAGRGALVTGLSRVWKLLGIPSCLPDCLILRPQDGELLMSPNDNQKGNQVMISCSGDIYHTAIKIWRVGCRFQPVISDLEQRPHVEPTYGDRTAPALHSEMGSRVGCEPQQTRCPTDGWERTGNHWTAVGTRGKCPSFIPQLAESVSGRKCPPHGCQQGLQPSSL